MNTFLTKIVMLVMFLLAGTCAWAAVTMVFPVTLYNILLVILAAFFLLRGVELADKVNKLGPYAEPEDNTPHRPETPGCHPQERDIPDDTPEDNLPDEE